MLRACQITKYFPLLAVLLAVSVMPVQAWAQAAPTSIPNSAPSGVTDVCGNDNTNPIDQSIATAMAQVTATRIGAAQAVVRTYGVISINAMYCINKIQDMITSLGNAADPLGFLFKAIANQVMALIQQACSVALSDVKQIEKFASNELNRICIPMPKLGLGLSALSLQAPTPCTGIPILNLQNMPQAQALPVLDFRKLLPRSGGPTFLAPGGP